MVARDEVSEFLFGRAPALKFEKVGTTHSGVIVDLEMQQARKVNGQLDFWEDGQKKMQLCITLETTYRDEEDPTDEGLRRLFVKGQMATALKNALRVKGVRAPAIGAPMAVRYIRDGAPNKLGNRAKEYEVIYGLDGTDD